MSKIDKLRDYLLENYVNGYGNLDIRGLDFGEFDGDVFINEMKVKGDLYQGCQDVKGDLWQENQKVEGDLLQNGQKVDGTLWQGGQRVEGNLRQSYSEIKGNYYCVDIIVGGAINSNEPTKLLKKITRKELAEMGYEVI